MGLCSCTLPPRSSSRPPLAIPLECPKPACYGSGTCRSRAYRAQGSPGASGSLLRSCPHHLSHSQPMSPHPLTLGQNVPHLRCWLPSHSHPQPLGTLSPCLPALGLLTESTNPSRPPPHSAPSPGPPPPTHPGLSLFTLPLTPQPSAMTRLPIKPVDFGILCSVSGALCCPSNGGVPSEDPPRPLPILPTQGPTCPSTAPLSALHCVPGPSWGVSSPPYPTPPLHSPLSAKASWFHRLSS